MLIVSAKHGQSPIDPTLTLNNASSVEFACVTADDGAYIWLVNPTPENFVEAKSDLLSYAPAGVARVLAGLEVYQHGFGDNRIDPRVPDLVVISKIGVIYASVTASKNIEHGGVHPDDLDVSLFVHNPNLRAMT